MLETQGFQVGGILSQEVREEGNRVGFEIIDLGSQKSAWLAHVKQKTGPTVGKYRVNTTGLET
jgi:nucleoside-triphosphatase